jgi:hypothetical protein
VFSPARSGPACAACLATYEPANATVQPFLETAASKTLVLARPPFGLPRSINIYMPQTNGTCVRKTKSRSTDQDNRSYYTIVPTRSVSPTHGRPRTGSHTHPSLVAAADACAWSGTAGHAEPEKDGSHFRALHAMRQGTEWCMHAWRRSEAACSAARRSESQSPEPRPAFASVSGGQGGQARKIKKVGGFLQMCFEFKVK